MRKIIADSSSLILLYKSGAAGFLLNNCRCIVPESVRDELIAPEHTGTSFFSTCFVTGRIEVMVAQENYTFSIRMGSGERDAISLYMGGCGDYVIIDDWKGASYCRREGIPYVNALLVVKIIFFADLISGQELEKMSSWLKNNGRYSKAVIEWAEMADAGELMEFLL